MSRLREPKNHRGEVVGARRTPDGKINQTKVWRLENVEGRRQFHAAAAQSGSIHYEDDDGNVRTVDDRWVDEGRGIFAVRKTMVEVEFDTRRLELRYASRKSGNQLTFRVTEIGDVPVRRLPLNISPVLESIAANGGTDDACVTLPSLLPGLDFYVSSFMRVQPGWIVHSGYVSPAPEPFAWTWEGLSADLRVWAEVSEPFGQDNINHTADRPILGRYRNDRRELVEKHELRELMVARTRVTRNRNRSVTFREHWTGEVTVRDARSRINRVSSSPADVEYPVRIR